MTLKSLTSSIISNSSDKLQSKHQLSPTDISSLSLKAQNEKVKTIIVNEMTLRYTSTLLPEPPILSYKTKGDLEQLVKDWTCSSLITIEGIGIPLGLWKKLYKQTRPGVWKYIKDQWIKFKFIVAGFKSFSTSEEFWTTMSFAPTLPNTEVVNFRKISETLRKMRKEQDQKDAALAREIYSKDQFRTIFSYRKQGKVLIMSRDQDIARRYRLDNNKTVYWDKEDSDSADEIQ